jgi:hypothetical protein
MFFQRIEEAAIAGGLMTIRLAREGIMRWHHTFVPAITETSKTGRARRENHPLFSTFRDSTAAHAEPTFLQFIIGLTRHRYRRIPCNLSDRFHHRRRWTGNWY